MGSWKSRDLLLPSSSHDIPPGKGLRRPLSPGSYFFDQLREEPSGSKVFISSLQGQGPAVALNDGILAKRVPGHGPEPLYSLKKRTKIETFIAFLGFPVG